MEFGKKHMEKYGWKEGKGLGKNEDGMVKPLKPNLKFDNYGIGHNAAEQFTNNWWEHLYNKAANNITVNNNQDAVSVSTLNEPLEITTKLYSLKRNRNTQYNTFLKTSQLTKDGMVDLEMKSDEIVVANILPALSDEQLFLACGGRTAHKPACTNHVECNFGLFCCTQLLKASPIFTAGIFNLALKMLAVITGRVSALNTRTHHISPKTHFNVIGARHGLKQTGKLSRIEKQEKLLLKQLKNVSLSDDEHNLNKKIKKLSKHKECRNKTDNKNADVLLPDEIDASSSCNLNASHKKKKRNFRKVSFNETVTEYYSREAEVSPKSTGSDVSIEEVPVIIESKIKDNNDNEVDNQYEQDANGQDEGIEQDLEDAEDTKNLSHASFEEAQINTLDKLSKEERRLLKKKRKLERRNKGATERFLEEMDPDFNFDHIFNMSGKKRKFKSEQTKPDEVITKKMHSETEFPERSKNKLNKKKRKKEKLQANQINSITQSLNQVCKISDNME